MAVWERPVKTDNKMRKLQYLIPGGKQP